MYFFKNITNEDANTDLLLFRCVTSFLVASIYCDVARLVFCSLLIESFINSPFPCPAELTACVEKHKHIA